MKTKNLKAEELKEINGGSLFGSNDSASDSTLTGMVGVDNLLSYNQSSQDGDQSQASSFSAGNGINADLGSAFKKITQ